jgi:hypothetical protein
MRARKTLNFKDLKEFLPDARRIDTPSGPLADFKAQYSSV